MVGCFVDGGQYWGIKMDEEIRGEIDQILKTMEILKDELVRLREEYDCHRHDVDGTLMINYL